MTIEVELNPLKRFGYIQAEMNMSPRKLAYVIQYNKTLKFATVNKPNMMRGELEHHIGYLDVLLSQIRLSTIQNMDKIPTYMQDVPQKSFE